jgi:predicted tellurium resistance membrane protein TerC
VLAIAGASKGNFWLIAFGLALSIPFVVFSSNLLSKWMDRFPVLIYLGAGILGHVGGEMILTDPFVVDHWHPGNTFRYAVEAVLVIAVIAIGRLVCEVDRRRSRPRP